jgi:hypothetical protein
MRSIFIWLLAVLLPVQGTLAAALMTAGPAHVHVQSALAPPGVLVDFRRVLPDAPPQPGHVLTAFGHFHRGASVQRHHHASNDASVVPVNDGNIAAAAGDGRQHRRCGRRRMEREPVTARLHRSDRRTRCTGRTRHGPPAVSPTRVVVSHAPPRIPRASPAGGLNPPCTGVLLAAAARSGRRRALTATPPS